MNTKSPYLIENDKDNITQDEPFHREHNENQKKLKFPPEYYLG